MGPAGGGGWGGGAGRSGGPPARCGGGGCLGRRAAGAAAPWGERGVVGGEGGHQGQPRVGSIKGIWPAEQGTPYCGSRKLDLVGKRALIGWCLKRAACLCPRCRCWPPVRSHDRQRVSSPLQALTERVCTNTAQFFPTAVCEYRDGERGALHPLLHARSRVSRGLHCGDLTGQIRSPRGVLAVASAEARTPIGRPHWQASLRPAVFRPPAFSQEALADVATERRGRGRGGASQHPAPAAPVPGRGAGGRLCPLPRTTPALLCCALPRGGPLAVSRRQERARMLWPRGAAATTTTPPHTGGR